MFYGRIFVGKGIVSGDHILSTLFVLSIILFNIEVASAGASHLNSSAHHEQNIHTEIFTKYSKYIPPKKNSTHVIVVNVTFYVRNILSLQESTEILTSSAWLDIAWRDFRLTWDEHLFGGIDFTRARRSNIWFPDYIVENTATKYNVVGKDDDLLKVTSDGNVRWYPSDVLQTRCHMDITYFPFDKQTCVVEIVTWNYDSHAVKTTSVTAYFPSEVEEEHGEWEVTGIHQNTSGSEWVKLVTYINLQRRSTFYVFYIVLPVIMTTFLTAFVFILPAESGEKITLATALFLSYAVFLSFITERMPSTSTTTSSLGVFVATQLVLSALSIMCSVVVLNFCKKETTTENLAMPTEKLIQFVNTKKDIWNWKNGIGSKLDKLFFAIFLLLGIVGTGILLVVLQVN